MNRINALTGAFERIPEKEAACVPGELAREFRELETEAAGEVRGANPLAALLGQFFHQAENGGSHSQSPQFEGLFGGLGGGIGGILERLRPDRLEAEDLMLMLILFFLYRESGDPEFIVIMAAMFLLD